MGWPTEDWEKNAGKGYRLHKAIKRCQQPVGRCRLGTDSWFWEPKGSPPDCHLASTLEQLSVGHLRARWPNARRTESTIVCMLIRHALRCRHSILQLLKVWWLSVPAGSVSSASEALARSRRFSEEVGGHKGQTLPLFRAHALVHNLQTCVAAGRRKQCNLTGSSLGIPCSQRHCQCTKTHHPLQHPTHTSNAIHCLLDLKVTTHTAHFL